MKNITGSTKLLIAILLILAAFCSYLFIEDDSLSVALLVFWCGLFLVLLFTLMFSGVSRRRRNRRIINGTPSVKAKLLSIINNTNDIIMQLQVGDSQNSFVSSHVIHHPNAIERRSYVVDQSISVHIDPDDPRKIILPIIPKDRTGRFRINWAGIIWIPIVIGSVVLPIAFSFFDDSAEDFQDVACVWNKDNAGQIWELVYSGTDQYIISIYDPIANERVKKVKESFEEDFVAYPQFLICQQKQRVLVVGTGTQPSIDIYDATDFEKVADLSVFEESNSFLNMGVATLNLYSGYNRLNKQQILMITTTDGKMCYYNIPLNEYYYTDKELENHFKQLDSLQIAQQMFAFVLSGIPNSVDKFQMNIVKSENKKSINALMQLAHSGAITVSDFNSQKSYFYKYCTIQPLCGDEYFLKAKIVYSDSEMVVLMYVTSLGDDAEDRISGIDKTGKHIFDISQSNFPQIDDMKEDNYTIRNESEFRCQRHEDSFTLLFSEYGAVCVDLGSGKVRWTHEP